jgi:hypothetical protein
VTCRRCAEDVADLRALREELQPSGARLGARTRPGWRGYAGMALVAAGLAGVLVWTSLGREAQPERDAASTDPAVSAAPATRAPVPRLVLRDGNETVTIDADGTLSGVPGLREEETRLVRQVLEEGRLRVPPFISALAGSSGTLMSGPPDPATFRPLRPLATAVESDRPQFEWTPLDRATAYVISVFDQNFDRITESPPLTEVSWRPAAVLARGRTYQWQVRASVGDREIVAPAPPASEARFRVLSRAEADRLAEARRRLTADLALGILLARAGVLDEAHDAFRRLATANPTSREPRMLLEDIRARRPGTARHDSGGGDQRPSPMSTNPAQ